MNQPSIIDPFHRALYQLLAEEIERRTVSLVEGGAARIMGDEKTVGEKYAEATSYIQALNYVLDVCKRIEDQRHGKRPGAEG